MCGNLQIYNAILKLHKVGKLHTTCESSLVKLATLDDAFIILTLLILTEWNNS